MPGMNGPWNHARILDVQFRKLLPYRKSYHPTEPEYGFRKFALSLMKQFKPLLILNVPFPKLCLTASLIPLLFLISLKIDFPGFDGSQVAANRPGKNMRAGLRYCIMSKTATDLLLEVVPSLEKKTMTFSWKCWLGLMILPWRASGVVSVRS